MRLCHAICCTNFQDNAIYCIDLQDKKIEFHRKYSTKGSKHLLGVVKNNFVAYLLI